MSATGRGAKRIEAEVMSRNTALLALSRLLPRSLADLTQEKLDHAHRILDRHVEEIVPAQAEEEAA